MSDDKYDLRNHMMETAEDKMSRPEKRRYEKAAKAAGLDPDDPDTPKKLRAYQLVTRVEVMMILGKYVEEKVIPLAYAMDQIGIRFGRMERAIAELFTVEERAALGFPEEEDEDDVQD